MFTDMKTGQTQTRQDKTGATNVIPENNRICAH